MAKTKVSPEFRLKLSEKLMDLGNLVATGFIIGQFIAERQFSVTLFIAGIALTGFCYLISYVLSS